MNTQQIIIAMLLAHLVADYTLQGWLAQGKMRSWWAGKCGRGYIAALVCHALYWSILVCIPFWSSDWFAAAVAVNTVVHAIVDDLKANRGKLSLIQDQLIHAAQIVATFAVLSLGRLQ